MASNTMLGCSEIESMIRQIIACGKITRADQQAFMSTLMTRQISSTENDLINRVFDLLRAGRLRVVD